MYLRREFLKKGIVYCALVTTGCKSIHEIPKEEVKEDSLGEKVDNLLAGRKLIFNKRLGVNQTLVKIYTSKFKELKEEDKEEKAETEYQSLANILKDKETEVPEDKAYLFRNSLWVLTTEDHSYVIQRDAKGEIKEIGVKQAEVIYTVKYNNLLKIINDDTNEIARLVVDSEIRSASEIYKKPQAPKPVKQRKTKLTVRQIAENEEREAAKKDAEKAAKIKAQEEAERKAVEKSKKPKKNIITPSNQ